MSRTVRRLLQQPDYSALLSGMLSRCGERAQCCCRLYLILLKMCGNLWTLKPRGLADFPLEKKNKTLARTFTAGQKWHQIIRSDWKFFLRTLSQRLCCWAAFSHKPNLPFSVHCFTTKWSTCFVRCAIHEFLASPYHITWWGTRVSLGWRSSFVFNKALHSGAAKPNAGQKDILKRSISQMAKWLFLACYVRVGLPDLAAQNSWLPMAETPAGDLRFCILF